MGGKSGKAGKGGWGDPLTDYYQGWQEEYETYDDQEELQEVEEDKEPGLGEWSVEQVAAWVRSVGPAFEDAAKESEGCGITGAIMFYLSVQDLEATLGKGLKTKKLWNEIRALVENADERARDKRIPVIWSFYTLRGGWRK